jgi:hypothetical protein
VSLFRIFQVILVSAIAVQAASCGGGERRLTAQPTRDFDIDGEIVRVHYFPEKGDGFIDLLAVNAGAGIVFLPDILKIRDGHRRAIELALAARCKSFGKFEVLTVSYEELFSTFRGRCK